MRESLRAFLFPSEFESLMACPRVPVRWRRIFMLATYLYARWGELEALEWNSVSFEHGYILIHQAVNRDTGAIKSTKTKDIRKVPIEPALLPLLKKMHEESKGEARVVTAMPPGESAAKRLRKYLGWAVLKRGDLFADDAMRRPLDFHDLRHTGITWRAVRGDDHLKVMRAAGHDDPRTTMRYVNEAQTFEGVSFGEPFPTIPLGLLSNFGSNNGFEPSIHTESPAFLGEKPCPQRESNPKRQYFLTR
jgi:integrase